MDVVYTVWALHFVLLFQTVIFHSLSYDLRLSVFSLQYVFTILLDTLLILSERDTRHFKYIISSNF